MLEQNVVEIVLIEDNPHHVELTLRALKTKNLANKIQVLRDGEEALDYLFGLQAHSSPKLVLLDLKLPKVDGLEVLRKIKGDERTKHIPVVVMTSSKEEKDIVTSYKLGVNSYIVKPVDFANFSEIIVDVGFYWLALNQSDV